MGGKLGKPRRVVSPVEHDFGTVARGGRQDAAFVISNPLREELHIREVRASCGCAKPVLSQDTIASGKKRTLTVTVVFDRPTVAEVQLQIRGYIRSDVEFAPGEVAVGDIDHGTAAERKVMVTALGRPGWRIVETRSENPHLEIRLAEPQHKNGPVQYEVVVHTPDATLVANKHDEEAIRKVVELLKSRGWAEYL